MASGSDFAVAPPPPPQPPNPAEPPHWPLWLPLAALAGGLSFGLMGVVILSGIVGGKADSPGVTTAGTVIVDLAVVGACILLAATVTRPRLWHFGLRSAPLGFTAAIAGIGVLAYTVFSVVYSVVVQPKGEQEVVNNLGADTNTALLIAGALVVIVVAPICEELFFRGFLYRVLRLRLPFWFAAVIDGVLFGIVHGTSTPISALPILAALGIVFCWVYERTGTLFATIALHALNNTISYGATTDNGWGAALPVGAVMLAACVMAVKRGPRGAPASSPS
jgi:membrane protease YdiL (CAAX protease family)